MYPTFNNISYVFGDIVSSIFLQWKMYDHKSVSMKNKCGCLSRDNLSKQETNNSSLLVHLPDQKMNLQTIEALNLKPAQSSYSGYGTASSYFVTTVMFMTCIYRHIPSYMHMQRILYRNSILSLNWIYNSKLHYNVQMGWHDGK